MILYTCIDMRSNGIKCKKTHLQPVMIRCSSPVQNHTLCLLYNLPNQGRKSGSRGFTHKKCLTERCTTSTITCNINNAHSQKNKNSDFWLFTIEFSIIRGEYCYEIRWVKSLKLTKHFYDLSVFCLLFFY